MLKVVEAAVPQPVDRFLRLPDVLAIYPVSRATWWAGVKTGRFPRPVKLGPRTTAWRLSDVDKLVASHSDEARRAA